MKPLLIAVTCLVLFACHGPSGHGYISLTPNALYSLDSVRLAMDGGDAKAAEKKLAAAIEQYKKRKDTLGSIPMIKDAILLKPTARAYFELSGVLLGTHRYPEAIQALHVAEKLGYTPLANVMFRYAYAYAAMMDKNSPNAQSETVDSALRYMELAMQMGYYRPQDFLRKDIFPCVSYFGFDAAYNAALSGMEGRDPSKSLWESYSLQFPEVSLPLIVNMPWIKSHNLEDQISYEFESFIPEMRSAKFDRGEGTMYYYVALVSKDKTHTVVLYGSEYEGDGEIREDEPDSTVSIPAAVYTLTPTFYLASYDGHGKIIDRMLVAGRADLDHGFKAFSVQLNMHFQIQEYTDEYRQDPATAGLDSSNYVGLKAQAPVNYLIDATGKFVKTDAPLAIR